MNAALIQRLTGNPHTTWAAVAIAATAVAEVWFPQYTSQLHKTRELAMTYGLIMAGDSSKTPAPPADKPTTPPTT